jgi:ProP effector
MSAHKSTPAHDTIVVLADLFPACFSVFQQCRKPLKVGIRDDVLAALNGAITAKEAGFALKVYTSNYHYLKACKEGAPRVGVGGEITGHVTAEEAANAKQRLALRQAKQARRRQTTKPTRRTTKPTKPAPCRLNLADLRAAAQARRASA